MLLREIVVFGNRCTKCSQDVIKINRANRFENSFVWEQNIVFFFFLSDIRIVKSYYTLMVLPRVLKTVCINELLTTKTVFSNRIIGTEIFFWTLLLYGQCYIHKNKIKGPEFGFYQNQKNELNKAFKWNTCIFYFFYNVIFFFLSVNTTTRSTKLRLLILTNTRLSLTYIIRVDKHE